VVAVASSSSRAAGSRPTRVSPRADAADRVGLDPIGQVATVHGIVKQHGGEILVDSVPGRGTIFQVYLSAAGDHVPAAVQPVADLIAKVPSYR
jgi:hypothetical protein